MSKIIKLSIIIVVLLILFGKSALWPNSNALIARNSTDKLQLEISLSSTQFLLGEPVLLQVIIKNIGIEPIRLPYRSFPYIDHRSLKYTLDGPKQPKELRNSEMVYDFGGEGEYPSEKNSHLLELGDEETVTTDLVKCSIAIAGHYKINVEYFSFQSKFSASLEFDVLQPKGEDAAFLSSMQEWFDNQKMPPEHRCYNHIGLRHIRCTDDLYRKHVTSRIATWILINEIMIPSITFPKNSIKKGLRYSAWVLPNYICDPSSPDGKRSVKDPNDLTPRLQWENETIDNILAIHPSAPFSASIAIQRALNFIALKDEANGLKLLGKFVQECNDKKIISRECNWAKEFIELWAQRKQTK